MRTFLIHHIDAVIDTALGLWITIYCWLHRERLRSSPKKLARALPILAPLILLFGVLSFTFNFQSADGWQRVSTEDQRASADFPCAATASSANDSVGGVAVKRAIVQCNVPQRDINLRLSYNEIPAEGLSQTTEQRLKVMTD